MVRKHRETTSETSVETPVEPTAEAKMTEASEQTTIELKETAVESESVAPSEGPSFLSELLPAIGGSVSKAVYGTFYYASYGVVFGALAVAHLIPMNNVMGRAITDGAADAKQALEKTAAASSAQDAVLSA